MIQKKHTWGLKSRDAHLEGGGDSETCGGCCGNCTLVSKKVKKKIYIKNIPLWAQDTPVSSP